MLIIQPPWWRFWNRKPDVYWGTPELCQKILRDKGIEDGIVNAAVVLMAVEIQNNSLKRQERRQTPPPNCPKPPGCNDQWRWEPPTGKKEGDWRWYDPNGGEWRRHPPDEWHSSPHWDHNPWDRWNSDWRNVDDQGNLIPKK